MHRKMLGIVVLIVLALTALPTAFAQPGLDKIEPRLLDQFAAEGQVDFVVIFAEQADLSPAYEMNWADRGEFVYNTLKATAARTQAGAIAYLDSLGLEHTTFIAGNELYVRAGNLNVATALVSLDAVDFIRATRTAFVDIALSQAAEPESPNALAWGLVDTNADDFWTTFGFQGDGIVVSNIDTGVQYNHPALDQAFHCASPSDAACWADPSNICGGSACDNNGHGTHVMGTMVGDDDPSLTWQAGMAPNAEWIACKGCESTSCSDTALNACADWLLAPGGSTANRPHVVNNSWGGGGCDTWYQAKVQAWRAAGIFPAFSAGNSTGCSSLGSPGDYQESFGTTGHNSSRVHSFAQGPSCFGHDPYTKPNISSPGVSVCSSVPTNAWSCGYSGTSMASPHSAGAVALLLSCNPSLIGQINQTFEALQNNTDAPDPANPPCGVPPDNQGTYEDGYGYLNVYQAGLAVCGATGYLAGHVYDSSNSNPIEGATVSADGMSTTTDAQGFYRMLLLAGTYDVTATHPLYLPDTTQNVLIQDGVTTTVDFNLDPLQTGTLYGYVRDADTSAPIQGALVEAAGGFSDNTDSTGYYSMTLLPGTYAVTATATGYTPGMATVNIVVGQQTQEDFDLSFVAEWTLATLTGCPDWTRYDAEFYAGTGKIYIMGGRSDANTLGDIYALDPLTNACTDTGVNMPTPISNYTINLVNNGTADLLCTFGGRNSGGTQTLDVQCYNPVANTISVVAQLPAAYAGFTPGAQAVAGNRVYVFGGFNPNASPYELARTDRFDPTTNTFTQVGNLSLARSYLQTAVVDGAIYAFGGTVFDGASLVAQTRTEKMADPGGAGTWDNAAVAEMPQAGAEGRGFGFDTGAIYGLANQIVLAPYNAQWSGASIDAAIYNVATNTYDTTFADLNDQRRDHAGVFVPLCSDSPADGLPGMWVLGGWSGGDTPPYGRPEYYPLTCPMAPTAEFDWDEPVCVGWDTQFNDLSTALPTAWYWDFADGGTSTDQNPVHTFATAADFDVYLLVTNTNGSDDVQHTVTVNPLPEASFDYAPDNGLMPLTVYFSNTSLSAANPTWDFGDGDVGAGDYVSHTYDMTGTYYVTLTVDSPFGCGTDEAYGMVTVVFETAPIASFDAVPMSGCGAPLEVQFTDTSVAAPPVTEWLWHFGDGAMSTETNPLHTYATTGDFVVTLWVTNTLGSGMVTDTISVYDLPMAMFDYDPPVGYAPLTVYFTDTSMYGENAVWDFGDGSMGAGDTVTHTYAMTGNFTVVLTVTSPFGCGDATANANVMVYEPGTCIPVSIVAVNQTPTGCVVDFAATLVGEAPFTYEWDFGAFGTFTTSTAMVDFGATGTYTGTLNVWNCTDSFDTESFTVDVTCEPPAVYAIYLPVVYK